MRFTLPALLCHRTRRHRTLRRDWLRIADRLATAEAARCALALRRAAEDPPADYRNLSREAAGDTSGPLAPFPRPSGRGPRRTRGP